MGDDRPSVYQEGEKLVIRGSATGHCIKALVAHGLGLSPSDHPDWLLEKFAEGDEGEQPILDLVAEKYNMVISDQQKEYEIPVGSKAVIRCHIDGIGTQTVSGVGYEVVVEAKAITESTLKVLENKGIEEMAYMAVQLSIEMAATKLPGLLACGIKDDEGKVVSLQTFSFDTPPVSLGKIKAKVLKLVGLIDEGVLPSCDYAQYPCQFYFLHEGEAVHKKKDVERVGEDDEAEWDQAASQYSSANRAEKQIKERKEEARDRLAKLFDQRGEKGGKVETAGYVINDVVVERKGGVDEKKLKEGGIDPDEYRKPGYEMRYPKIEAKGIEEDDE